MPSKIYIMPNANSTERRVQQWLDSKVNDELVVGKYDVERYHIGQGEYNPDMFDRYYNKDSGDQDVAASDTSYITLVDTEKLHVKKLDDQLAFIDKSVERYEQESVLIPPHSNRWHANHLFKQLVDYCASNKLLFETEEGDVEHLIDVNFKDAFYEFCYDNTSKHKSRV